MYDEDTMIHDSELDEVLGMDEDEMEDEDEMLGDEDDDDM